MSLQPQEMIKIWGWLTSSRPNNKIVLLIFVCLFVRSSFTFDLNVLRRVLTQIGWLEFFIAALMFSLLSKTPHYLKNTVWHKDGS